jgi:transposase
MQTMRTSNMSKISMKKISEILRQRYKQKLSYRVIARSQNVSIGTISDQISRAKAAGIFSWEEASTLTEQQLYEKLFLPVDKKITVRPKPDNAWINKEIRRKGVTLKLLWREYREQIPTGIGYTQFCVQYQTYKRSITPSMRQIHKAGEKVFVDYAGMTVPWVDVSTGEIYKAEIFVGCLGASQYTYVEASKSQQLADWLKSNTNFFEFLGGISEIIVPDNLKSGVTKSHRYDPDINANYQHWAEHYGVAIVPARARAPKDKAKVENAVGCIERQILAPLRDRTFTSIAEINLSIAPALKEFNCQKLQKMNTSRQRLFEEIDKPELKPLPQNRYQYAIWQKAKIHIDYHVVFDNHYYSTPYKYIHQKVELRVTTDTLECFYKGERIAAHQRSYKKYGFTTLESHMPKSHKEHAKWTPDRLRNWASKSGGYTEKFISTLISARSFPQQAYRACLGIMRLGDRFGHDKLEMACSKALLVGATRYKHIESILKNKLESVPLTNDEEDKAIPHHENIRGADYYH